VQWEAPSPRVRELIRAGAEIALNAPPEWLDELDEATLAVRPEIAGDPELAAASSRTNRANMLHWVAANIQNPGAPVPANLGTEPLGIARDMVRRGFDERALDAYRVGQNVAWRRWMEIAFTLTVDPQELRELLVTTQASITAFVDATIAGIEEQIRSERDELVGGAHAERREVVALIVEGAPITRNRAEQRLGYRLDQTHTAVVVWTDNADADPRGVDQVAEAVGRATRTRPLSIPASTATRWVWVATTTEFDDALLRAEVSRHHHIRVALGSTLPGLEGFRRSHLDALTTQRMMSRLGSAQRMARFSDIELVALLTHDQERTDEFISNTLGQLAEADVELRQTVLTYINDHCNATKAAVHMYTHRNTLLRRIARAEQLLPTPLEASSVRVAVALEVLSWIDSRNRHAPGG
jgi:DNA-binding PucR family transcriptional regulator